MHEGGIYFKIYSFFVVNISDQNSRKLILTISAGGLFLLLLQKIPPANRRGYLLQDSCKVSFMYLETCFNPNVINSSCS